MCLQVPFNMFKFSVVVMDLILSGRLFHRNSCLGPSFSQRLPPKCIHFPCDHGDAGLSAEVLGMRPWSGGVGLSQGSPCSSEHAASEGPR